MCRGDLPADDTDRLDHAILIYITEQAQISIPLIVFAAINVQIADLMSVSLEGTGKSSVKALADGVPHLAAPGAVSCFDAAEVQVRHQLDGLAKEIVLLDPVCLAIRDGRQARQLRCGRDLKLCRFRVVPARVHAAVPRRGILRRRRDDQQAHQQEHTKKHR